MRQRIEAAVPALRGRLEREHDAEARSSLALALAELATPESGPAFQELLGDADESNRSMALRGLSLIGDDSVVGAAIHEYRNPAGRDGKQEALDALERLGSPELQHLFDEEKSWWWRRRIRRALRSAPISRS